MSDASQRHPNQNLSPALDVPPAGPNTNPATNSAGAGNFGYDGVYSSVGEAPMKPPRQLVQPSAEIGVNYGTQGLANDQPRRSAYPYQPSEGAYSVERLPNGQQRIAQPADDLAGTQVKRPISSYPQGSVTVSGNPDDLYAKVMKKRPPDDMPGQRGTDFPSRFQAETGNQPGYGFGTGRDVNSPFDQRQQDQRQSARKPNGLDAGRDYNFNVPKAESQLREPGQQKFETDVYPGDRSYSQSNVGPPAGSFRSSEPKVFSRGERYLDGTPMFGDHRKDAKSPGNVQPISAGRDRYADDLAQVRALNSQQNLMMTNQRPVEPSIFKYPSVSSQSQVCFGRNTSIEYVQIV